MNLRSLVFLCMALVLASFAQARLGDEVPADATPGAGEKKDERELGSSAMSSGRYSAWATRCCGQNNNRDCKCPIRRNYPNFRADTWARKCAEAGF